MAFNILVNSCVRRPSFSLLESAFKAYGGPNGDIDADKSPCKDKIATNQCAVRLSIALVRCGFGMEGFPVRHRVHSGRSNCGNIPLPDHVLGAQELERFLRNALGVSREFRKEDDNFNNAYTELNRNSLKGIIYFNDIFLRQDGSAGDHIDLFNGTICGNEWLKITPGGGTGFGTRSFFRRANRISFFELPR